jgi:hypothetical protein
LERLVNQIRHRAEPAPFSPGASYAQEKEKRQ